MAATMPMATGSAALPAKQLVGIELEGGWKVIERLGGDDDQHTPGFFSVGYLATRNEERAFMKAFDVGAILQMSGTGNDPSQMMRHLQTVTSAFNAEHSLLTFCATSKLDKIVRVIGTGSAFPAPGSSSHQLPVPYLLFELAEGDIRKYVGKSSRAEDQWRLSHLHDVAVGLQQLHSHRIAHQDLKPANVLVFDGEGAKIADLGRASRDGAPAPHDEYQVPGDVRYAPPELRYGETPTSWVDRREASDLYHLGSLMCFLFTGVSVNAALERYTPEALRPFDPHTQSGWRGRYHEVLPHLVAAFTRVLDEVRPQFPDWAAEELVVLLSQMCTPDYTKRGAPETRFQPDGLLGMDRFISRFDRLAKLAAVRVQQKL